MPARPGAGMGCDPAGGWPAAAAQRDACRRSRRDARPGGELHGNRLYTLLPGHNGRASAHSLYSRRVRHPSRHSSANTLPMQETP
ncbi:hypothetical protein DIE14_07630 [Burkholderia sp. Bp9017]|nr:hypothetical protein DIE14_07630 [Burkholderia sp. Bp9017]RQZ35924.1 hypothetical protein DIE13_08595 [Burkholderia sp. Bp9016]